MGLLSKKPRIFLKLANGRILDDCQAGATESALWLYLKGLSMPEAAQIAFNPEGLEKIEFYYSILHNTYVGYTEAKAIIQRGETIEVQLIGGKVIEEEAENEGDSSGDGSDVVSDGAGSGN